MKDFFTTLPYALMFAGAWVWIGRQRGWFKEEEDEGGE